MITYENINFALQSFDDHFYGEEDGTFFLYYEHDAFEFSEVYSTNNIEELYKFIVEELV